MSIERIRSLSLSHRVTVPFDQADRRRRQHAVERVIVGVNGELFSAFGFGHDVVVVMRARHEAPEADPVSVQCAGARPGEVGAKATCENGVLEVSVPLAARSEAKPRVVEIEGSVKPVKAAKTAA
jgi:hypothetical protein